VPVVHACCHLPEHLNHLFCIDERDEPIITGFVPESSNWAARNIFSRRLLTRRRSGSILPYGNTLPLGLSLCEAPNGTIGKGVMPFAVPPSGGPEFGTLLEEPPEGGTTNVFARGFRYLSNREMRHGQEENATGSWAS
jgi:hypothetical protein